MSSRMLLRHLSRLSTSASAVAERRYCLRTHTWMEKATNGVNGGLVRIGLTRRHQEDIGDVVAITAKAKPGDVVTAYASLVQIDWDAFQISDGDELYHTTWANVEGEAMLKAPWYGVIAAVNIPTVSIAGGADLDSLTIEMEAMELPKHLVNEVSYLEQCGVGRFGSEDAEERLSYTSYG